MISHPPRYLDKALVLYYCHLSTTHKTGNHTLRLENGEFYTPANAAIARYDNNSKVYRFYCDENWTVVSDFDHISIEEAIDEIENGYRGARKETRKAHPVVVEEQWYLMDCSLPNLNWARIRIFQDGVAEVFDMDGRITRFITAEEAYYFLREDEFVRFDELDDEEVEALRRPLHTITPPKGETDEEILPRMFQPFDENI
jgi:hypothetical protein